MYRRYDDSRYDYPRYGYPRYENTWKILVAVLIIIVVAVAVIKLSDAITEASRARTVYQQQQYERELREAEAKAAVEDQALRDRRAVQSELLRLGGTLGLVTGSIAVLALAFAFSYRLMINTNISPKEPEPARKQFVNITTTGASPEKQQLVKKQHVHPNRTSYDGFLAFCDDYLLSNGRRLLPNYDYSRPDAKREYYPDGISADVAEFYVSVLKKTPILRMGNNGCDGWMILSPQINTLGDIKLRISQETFKGLRAVGQKGAG